MAKVISIQIELPDDTTMAEAIFKVRAIAALVGGDKPQCRLGVNTGPVFVIKQPQVATVN